ncbi:solute carrier family 23 member 2 [Galendromus occidentalis]|uniref:Solute carrier family 23 member 2 n=1 Tax=Galendromus occidentalis TaxID=34638 RepID=A0AAJ6QNG9_9ACAR|nr:solute carrier family 23 member 2 [Galendromus occidentalis]
MDNPALNIQEPPGSPGNEDLNNNGILPQDKYSNIIDDSGLTEIRLDTLPRIKAPPPSDDRPRTDVVYKVDDVPPWYLCLALGFQHYLTMMGGVISYPFIVAPKLCIPESHPARGILVSTIFFVSGIGTLLQATFGVRLPIIQGSTFTFLVPIIAIMSLPQWECPDPESISNLTMTEADELWMPRMREIQGAIIAASAFEFIAGLAGLVGLLLRFITPLAITPTIALIGLSLYPVAAEHAQTNWPIAILTLLLVATFSQYLRDTAVPVPFTKSKDGRTKRFEIFKVFPVVLAIGLMWFLCWLLTVAGAAQPGNPLRTDHKIELLRGASWFRIPYPFQWGAPTFTLGAIVGILAGVVVSIVESVGDYHACARLSAAPSPPLHAVNRGIAAEGIGSIIAATFGAGCGLTSFSENIGAIGITKVASRRVIQTGALMMLVLGSLGKVGALFVTIPEPIIGGVFIVMFSMVTAVGVSNLQHVDLNSSRNLFVLGSSLFLGLCIPGWVSSHPDALVMEFSPLLSQVLRVLLSTSMFVGGFLGIMLDNTVPGTAEERGLVARRDLEELGHGQYRSTSTYDPPFLERMPEWTRSLPFMPDVQRHKSPLDTKL